MNYNIKIFSLIFTIWYILSVTILYALIIIFVVRPWSNIEEAFADACTYGYLKVAQLLLILKPNMDISANNESAFIGACVNGHLKVVKWLRKIKPDINIYANHHHAFIDACKYGHLEVAKLLSYISSKYIIDFSKIKSIEYIILENELPISRDTKVPNNNKNEICSICYFLPIEMKTNCNHNYCHNCISTWYSRNDKKTCPLCNQVIHNIYEFE